MKRPIFVVGTGRSGSTIFYKLLVKHPRVAWTSGITDHYPHNLSYHRLMLTLLDVPLVGKLVERRFPAGEVYNFWENHVRGFRRPYRDLTSDDVTAAVKRDLPTVFEQLVTAKRQQLVHKLTGWGRIAFLHEIFPDALFIHIVRDGRAVAYSLTQVDFWDGWQGPQHWRSGELTPEQRAVWAKHGQSFFALAGLQWNIHMTSIERGRQVLNDSQFFEFKYEDMCADTTSIFRQVCDFCELDWTPGFEAMLRRNPLNNTNYKWETELTPQQQAILNDVMRAGLVRYGYV
ncbi:MAG: sulfotransferase [Chloroflexi bacterium]|nr:sulfotransferase [Chloroflexota bacterium]